MSEKSEQPFARAGDRVTSPEGEYVCRVAVDLYRTGTALVANFDDWQVDKPKALDRIDNTPGFRTAPRNPGKCQVHINGRWLP